MVYRRVYLLGDILNVINNMHGRNNKKNQNFVVYNYKEHNR